MSESTDNMSLMEAAAAYREIKEGMQELEKQHESAEGVLQHIQDRMQEEAAKLRAMSKKIIEIAGSP